MLAGGSQSDRPQNLRAPAVQGGTGTIIEESMGEFDETFGESQQIGVSTSMQKGHKAGKKGMSTRNAKSPGGPSVPLRQSADKGSKKHVTISEEAASQSPSQTASYYGDEWESLSKSHISASRRTSKERRASKKR